MRSHLYAPAWRLRTQAPYLHWQVSPTGSTPIPHRRQAISNMRIGTLYSVHNLCVTKHTTHLVIANHAPEGCGCGIATVACKQCRHPPLVWVCARRRSQIDRRLYTDPDPHFRKCTICHIPLGITQWGLRQCEPKFCDIRMDLHKHNL